ncbi:general substrate transporter [Morchella conica CCBAS932]|uniref:General substrate transporter n=2 Tax=Morchella sect. Distantes TaxID=1051054 RepID=A0A3N4L1F5_9PEZI|nr:general substrate transporter [Morchella conica CCBAS932]
MSEDSSHDAAIAFPKPSLWSKNSLKLYTCLAVGYLVSTMNGYDGSLMGAVNDMEQYQKSFGMNGKGSSTGIVFIIYNLGQIAAFPFCGWLADGYGRRWAIFIGCVIVVIGAAVQTPANTMGQFQAGRFILGFGASIAGAAAPTYTVEISHPAYRGTQAGLYNVCWYLGSIIASWCCVGSNRHMHNSWAWRTPTVVQAAVPGIVAILVLFLPESPRWLISQDRNEEAIAILAKYHGEGDRNSSVVQIEYQEMTEQISSSSSSSDKMWWNYKDLFNTRAARYRIGLVIAMAFFGQWSGNNVVSYYMPTMFAQTGIESSDTRLVLNGIYPIFCMFAAIWGATLLDRLGRRNMLIGATSFTVICFAIITAGTAVSSSNKSASYAVIVFIYLFGMAFSWAYTPLQALYSAEVLETKTRAKGSGLNFLFLNIAMCVNTFAAPVAMEKIGWRYYLVFVGWNCFEVFVIWKWFVETSGHTLEQLTEIFESPNPVKKSLEKRVVIVDEKGGNEV